MTDPVAEARHVLATRCMPGTYVPRLYGEPLVPVERKLLAALADEVELLRDVADAARHGDDVALMAALNTIDWIAGDGGAKHVSQDVADPSAATDLARAVVPRADEKEDR